MDANQELLSCLKCLVGAISETLEICEDMIDSQDARVLCARDNLQQAHDTINKIELAALPLSPSVEN